jgi:hypothetical protein
VDGQGLTSFRVLILQGPKQKPENNINFSTWKRTATPFLNSVMSEKWYHLILKSLLLAVHEKCLLLIVKPEGSSKYNLFCILYTEI